MLKALLRPRPAALLLVLALTHAARAEEPVELEAIDVPRTEPAYAPPEPVETPQHPPAPTPEPKSAAEEKSADPKAPPRPRAGKLYFIPGPSFAVNPVYGIMLGVGATASYYFGDPKTTRASNALVNFSLTSKGQFINTYRSFIYTKDDEWILIGDWRYLNSAEPTYGLGTGPDSAKLLQSGGEYEYNDDIWSGPLSQSQLLSFEQFRFHETVFRKVYKSTYVGLGYHLDVYDDIQDSLLDLENNVITSHYAYSELRGFDPTQYYLSGLSINALYDSRDSPVGTYSGTYARIGFRMNPTFLGSSQNSTFLLLDARQFLDLSPDASGRDVLAGWAIGAFTTTGAMPYLDLPATSYDLFGKSGRGYVQGRFRGDHFVYAELEYRRRLFVLGPVPIGGVLFFNLQTAGMSGEGVQLFDYVEPGGGGGLRVTLQRATRLSIALDYGVGNYGSTGFYVRMNDTF